MTRYTKHNTLGRERGQKYLIQLNNVRRMNIILSLTNCCLMCLLCYQYCLKYSLPQKDIIERNCNYEVFYPVMFLSTEMDRQSTEVSQQTFCLSQDDTWSPPALCPSSSTSPARSLQSVSVADQAGTEEDSGGQSKRVPGEAAMYTLSLLKTSI